MKKLCFALAANVVLSVSCATVSYAAMETYMLDPLHTNVYWHAGHMGFSNPSGKFTNVSGILKLDEDKPENSSLNVTIGTGSVMTGIEKFDDHLKSADFFNSKKYPVSTFISDKVEVGADKKTARVHGKLMLLGVTKPVVLDVGLNKIGVNPMTGKKTAGFNANTFIRRSDFGMEYGLPNIADYVRVTIEAEAILQSKAKK